MSQSFLCSRGFADFPVNRDRRAYAAHHYDGLGSAASVSRPSAALELLPTGAQPGSDLGADSSAQIPGLA